MRWIGHLLLGHLSLYLKYTRLEEGGYPHRSYPCSLLDVTRCRQVVTRPNPIDIPIKPSHLPYDAHYQFPYDAHYHLAGITHLAGLANLGRNTLLTWLGYSDSATRLGYSDWLGSWVGLLGLDTRLAYRVRLGCSVGLLG